MERVNAEARRLQFVSAAAELFDSEGYHAVNVEFLAHDLVDPRSLH